MQHHNIKWSSYIPIKVKFLFQWVYFICKMEMQFKLKLLSY